ncbi:MAG TPA: hypothetical protein VF652_05285 [Allosphingosinicella sp.]
MTKGRLIAAMLGVAATLSLPAPVFANHGDPIYRIRYYSDSSYAQQVGQDDGYCIYYGPAYSHTGQATNYATYELLGYCAERGEYEPI